MTVAISAHGPTLDDVVDDRFGRAHYLVIVSEEGFFEEVIDNSENRNAMQGAGIGTAELVANKGVDKVITGHLGPKAFGALAAAGISGFSGSGLKVRDAVGRLKAGELDALTEAGPAHGG